MKTSFAKNVLTYMLLFFFASLGGFIWEVLVYRFFYDSTSLWDLVLHYRGVLHGPWVPIYGFGCLALALLWNLLKDKKLLLFFCNTLSCAVIEYITACVLEQVFHMRWWDYSDFFLNINGKICFLSVFVFGILGTAVILFIMPRYLRLMQRISKKVKLIIVGILSVFFVLDVIYSLTTLLQRT